MRAQSKSTTRLLMVLLASAALGLAQTSTNHNPAGPGTVNYVEGEVSLNGQPLTQQSVGSVTLAPGQDLKTGNGYAEVLLTPGAFLRIGNGSEIQLESAGLANTHVRFLSGSGLLEVDQLIKGTDLSIDMNRDSAHVLKNGLYNFDDSAQVVRVLDGKLKVDSSVSSKEIGKDDEILFANGDNFKKTGFSSSLVKDTPLYTWSEARSRLEAQENQTAAQNANYYVGAGTGWYWDPYLNFYGFWPASAYLYSPFGFGFYSPAFFGYYGGYYGRPWVYGGLRAGYRGYVGGTAHIAGGFHGGFAGGHGGGRR